MARNPALWIRVPNGGTPDNPAVYTAIRDSLREISEAVRLLQGGPTATASPTQTTTSSGAQYTNSGPNIYLPLAGGTMTGLLATVASATSSSGFRLPHGTAPTSPVNGDMWTTTSGLFAYINGTTVGPFSAATGVYLPLAGGTMTGLLTTAVSALAGAGLNLPHGAAPTTPVNGDVWTTTTGIYARISGVTVGPLAAAPTGQALTRVNDTNVTLTLGGAPTTALLAAASITVGWSGTLGLARGGTGADLSATGGTGQYVKQATAGGAFTVGTIPASDIASGAALTKVDDTNVTLTLGGTPASALLKATSITAGWSGTLAQTRGGFGADISSTLQNLVYASPNGSTGAPTFRALVAADIPSLSSVYLPLAGGTMAGAINMSNNDITNVNLLSFNDPGASEGVNWLGGNLWRIYESPNALTNAAGNLQFTRVISSVDTRLMTLDTSGNLEVTGNLGAGITPSYRFHADSAVTAITNTFTAYINSTITPASASTAVYYNMYSRAAITGSTLTGAVLAITSDITHNATSNLSSGYGILASAALQNTGGFTNLYSIYINPLSRTGTGTITNSYGMYINAQKVTGVTNGYGVYQAGASDLNILEGSLGIGGSPSYPLHVVNTITSASESYGQYDNITVTPGSASAASYVGLRVAIADTGANLTGTLYGTLSRATHNGTNTVSNIIGAYSQSNITNTGAATSAYSFYAAGPSNSSTGVMTTSSGLYIATQKGTNVTTGYGVYQASSADLNIFVGKTAVGSTTTPTQTLEVTGTGYFSSDVGIGITPSYRLHVYEADTAATSGNVYLAQLDFRAIPASSSTATYIGLQSSALVSGANAIGNLYGAFLYATHSSSSTVTGLYGVVARYLATNTGNATTGAALFASTPSITSTGTITNGFGLYVNTQTVAGVTNGYGIYQVGASDENIFAGNTRIGSTTAPTNALDVTGAVTVSGDLTVDTNTLYVDATNNAVAIGAATITKKFNVTQAQNAETASLTYNTDAGSSAKASWLLYTNAYAGLEMSSSAGGGGLKLYNPNSGGLLFESVSLVRQRIPGVKSVTDATATGVVTLTLSAASFAGCTIIYTIEATDGTNHQSKSGIVHVAAARNTAGTASTPQVSDTVTATSTTSGTLTSTWTAAYASGLVTVSLNADTSLAASAGYPRVRYTIFNNGSEGIAIL